ncbi:hypothetical protein UFOVP115_89 [uncultured Caudovirales phage]|uniref:Uncharacterized protein n=1 Tax=uncultured Caudovirales phage TaxID=2100421 RepID=A0A6J5L8P0_9CAUD|nr:hypothetical protein UFOVP115_89 [uncultured Caudovirales phage]
MRAICAVCDKDRIVIEIDVAKGVSKTVCPDCLDEFLYSLTYTPTLSAKRDPDDERKYGR